MRSLNAKHRIYLLYRQSEAEESMIRYQNSLSVLGALRTLSHHVRTSIVCLTVCGFLSFIRDKLLRKGCSVIQDVTQSTTVLVLLTPGVFEFIDDPDVSAALPNEVTRELMSTNCRSTWSNEFSRVACDPD